MAHARGCGEDEVCGSCEAKFVEAAVREAAEREYAESDNDDSYKALDTPGDHGDGSFYAYEDSDR